MSRSSEGQCHNSGCETTMCVSMK